jgi:thiol-disulfide isomerase/thioredoxin
MSMNQAIARWAAVVAVALAALAAGLYFSPGVSRDSPAAALIGLVLPDIDGREQRLEQWQGKVLVVNFWATWCEPCREEMPEFVKAQAAFGGKGLQFVGISIDQPDKIQQIRQFSRDLKLNYPSLVGGYGALELSKSFGNKIMALPFTLIIDRKGQVAYSQMGPLKPDKLETIIGKLL